MRISLLVSGIYTFSDALRLASRKSRVLGHGMGHPEIGSERKRLMVLGVVG